MGLTDEAKAIADAQPPHPTLSAALVAALADLTVVHAGNRADMGTYSYKYAGLPDVVNLTRPVLQRHGIVALTPVHDHGDRLACTVVLIHTSGERIDLGPFPFPHGKDAQATGSWVTYIRRYALIAALGMATGEDDDGAAARPAPAPFRWTKGAVKARLVELLGDKDKAALVWTECDGDSHTPDADLAELMIDQFNLAHQEAEA